jgi:hypothetical protein
MSAPAAIKLAAAACAVVLLGAPASRAAGPAGLTIDFEQARGSPLRADRSWRGRAWLHPRALAAQGRSLPLVVFLHGLNKEHVRYRNIGGGGGFDIRALVGDLVDRAEIEPVVVAAPTTTVACESPRSMWPGFDLGAFLSRASEALGPRAVVDPSRVVLVGHSGAGCNTAGGMLSALRGAAHPRAVLAIDTCMDVVDAPLFALAPAQADVVIAWQPLGWERPAADFERAFAQASAQRASSGLRRVERMTVRGWNPHVAIVKDALAAWLPRWLSGAKGPPAPG